MKLRVFVSSIVVMCCLTACAPTGLNRADYNSRLAKVQLGMTKTEFMSVFPSSVPRGAKQYSKGSVEVLEVLYEYYAFVPTGNRNRNPMTGMEGQPQWFYFYDNKLVQYGEPGDWPAEPDLVIEHRRR